MEATVTMSLKEVEKLKLTISNLEKENEELKSMVKPSPSHYFSVYYDFSMGTSVFNAFGCEVFNEDNVDNRFEEIVKSNFEDIFTKSKENKFYQKFPKWVHKILKCD